MKVQSDWLKKLGGLGVATLAWRWMSTLDYQALYYDRLIDPVDTQFQGPAVFLFWHEYIPFLFYLRGHCNVAMLVSRHEDAELLSYAARHLGFQTVRGSTGRGGTAALRELIRRSNRMNLAITPDGPRGPRRKLASGPIYLSSRLGIPLVPIGLGYDRPWRTPTWDRFAVPRPHSRARAVAGPAVQVPSGVDRNGVEHYRRRVERLLNFLTEQAENWADAGDRRAGQCPVQRQSAPRRRDRSRKVDPQITDSSESPAVLLHPAARHSA